MEKEFKIGSQWETRGGWRAVVVDVLDTGTLRVWHSEYNETEKSKPDGRLFAGVGNAESDYDLLRPWVEKRSGWVNVYRNGKGDIFANDYIYGTKDEADADSTDEYVKCIACVKWTEGDGV